MVEKVTSHRPTKDSRLDDGRNWSGDRVEADHLAEEQSRCWQACNMNLHCWATRR